MSETVLQRPRRWDEPFCTEMSETDIDQVLESPFFAQMDFGKFPESLNLRDIILNDCRVRYFRPDELMVRAGAYINAAFLLLSGNAELVLAPGIDPKAWGQVKPVKPSVVSTFKNWLGRPAYPEVRDFGNDESTRAESKKTSDARFIPDLNVWVEQADAETLSLAPGDFFGESAVLGRTEMTNTVVSSGETKVLEIRWQGLRDIGKYAPEFKQKIESLYRERGLIEHLLSVPLFQHVSKEKLHALAEVALFEIHGEFAWQKSFQKATKQSKSDADVGKLIEAEPIIAKEGDYPDGLLLVRNGFARISRYINHGHYTFGNLSGGHLFGLQELYDSWLSTESQPLRCSLRALGYTDIIRIPTHWLEDNVFATDEIGAVQRALEKTVVNSVTSAYSDNTLLDRKFTEFLVENRLVNGTQTMMIDLDRCVRCDDCVTACANAHNNNPRFVRHGPTFGQYMIANACMHCVDPVCMIGCPTGAIHRQEDGTVTINDKTCIGCSTCANSCPYDNIRMVPVRDKNGMIFEDEKSKPIIKATKCDLCSQVPGGPACERACAHDALIRIDVKNTRELSDWIGR